MQPPNVETEIERALDRPPSQSRRRFDRARALLRDLASREESDLPVVSGYFDLRRPGDATDPAVREARIVLRRARDEPPAEVAKHGRARESFDADIERIDALLEGAAQQRERGLAVFACSAEGLFESFLAWAPFESRVEVGRRAFLTPLARLVDHDPWLVAIAETNGIRLFVSQPGRLEEVNGIADDADPFNRTDAGSPAQAEHRVDELRRDVARRGAELVARTLELEHAASIVIAGVETATTLLRDHLPKGVAERVRATTHVGQASHGEIEEAILPIIARVEAEDAREAADRLLGAVAADGAGVAGFEPTRRAVEIGQGLELLVEETGPASEAEVETLVRLAASVGTPITFVTGHDGLREVGGVGALLRYTT